MINVEITKRSFEEKLIVLKIYFNNSKKPILEKRLLYIRLMYLSAIAKKCMSYICICMYINVYLIDLILSQAMNVL